MKFKVLFYNPDELMKVLIVSEFLRQFTVSKVVCGLRNLFLVLYITLHAGGAMFD